MAGKQSIFQVVIVTYLEGITSHMIYCLLFKDYLLLKNYLLLLLDYVRSMSSWNIPETSEEINIADKCLNIGKLRNPQHYPPQIAILWINLYLIDY